MWASRVWMPSLQSDFGVEKTLVRSLEPGAWSPDHLAICNSSFATEGKGKAVTIGLMVVMHYV